MGRSSHPQDQTVHVLWISNGILLSQEATETPTCNDCWLVTVEVCTNCVDVVDNLGKGVWLGVRTLAMTTVVK